MARFNRVAPNHLMVHLTGHVPGFGVVTHTGRSSGRTYRTPVNVFRHGDGFEFALTYGPGDWVQNVLHAGGGALLTRGREYLITEPRLVHDEGGRDLPMLVRFVLRRLHVHEYLDVRVGR
jgi:deazaflavin-dependent oxidoreductase (nitroreductase family)